MLKLSNEELKILESFRTKEELKQYLEHCGYLDTEFEINRIKQVYEKNQIDKKTLDLKCLDKIVGGAYFVKFGNFSNFYPHSLKVETLFSTFREHFGSQPNNVSEIKFEEKNCHLGIFSKFLSQTEAEKLLRDPKYVPELVKVDIPVSGTMYKVVFHNLYSKSKVNLINPFKDGSHLFSMIQNIIQTDYDKQPEGNGQIDFDYTFKQLVYAINLQTHLPYITDKNNTSDTDINKDVYRRFYNFIFGIEGNLFPHLSSSLKDKVNRAKEMADSFNHNCLAEEFFSQIANVVIIDDPFFTNENFNKSNKLSSKEILFHSGLTTICLGLAAAITIPIAINNQSQIKDDK